MTHTRSVCVGVAETGQGSEGGRRESSLLTFAALLVTQKRDKKNPFYDFSQKSLTNKKTRLFRTLEKRVIMPAYRVICLN